MTRETKIGLLVGLAFIIVIGILLSDHMTATTEVPQASLVSTGNSVREGVAAPATEQPSNTVVISQAPITPHQTVPTHNEGATPIRASDSDVHVGPGHGEIPPPFTTNNRGSSAQSVGADPRDAQAAAPHRGSAPPAAPETIQPPARSQDGGISSALQREANAKNEQLVPVAQRPESSGPTKHVAENGDSLSKMAARFLGSNSKANRDLIVKANPSLQADPNMVVVGRTYVIPAATGSPATPAAPSASRTPASPLAGVESPEHSAAIWYTVKENDSLWTIAAEKLGNGGAYTAIKELNKDILKGGDTVVPNMRLRLPADKPVGSASAQ